jgi:tetratricopeptide (TPR) repeat protein
VAGEDYGADRVETLRMYDRNAITWSDDRRVAAFVAAKDPSVMRFAKNVASAVKGKGPVIFPEALLTAIALHEALGLYGMNYQADPSTPYTEFSKNADAIDYLQFPAQSLQFRAGDCDDLSILNAALLEALGVETAFITVPGHIYIAFDLGLSPSQAAARFPRAGDLIFARDKVWLPVEITLTKSDFLKAWETGADEWRTAGAQAKLYPVHEAWSVYEPVGFTSSGPEIAVPDSQSVLGTFTKSYSRIVERDLGPQESALQAKIKIAQNDPRYVNNLGVLYARYGLSDKAEAQFKSIAGKKAYTPAIVNLANLRFLSNDMKAARELYESADKAQPGNPATQLGLARTSYELGDYPAAARYYGTVKSLDPTMAAAYAYLESGTEANAATRAASAGGAGKELQWDE